MQDHKLRIITSIIDDIDHMINSARASRSDAIEESRHHKGAMESRYDTFKEEAQYLMSAQDLRINELTAARTSLSQALSRPMPKQHAVGLYSLVTIEWDDSGELAHYLVLPFGGGGEPHAIEAMSVHAISISSPIGHAIMGLSEGEEAELVIAGKQRTIIVVSIM